jgi:hypothetical protein
VWWQCGKRVKEESHAGKAQGVGWLYSYWEQQGKKKANPLLVEEG